jgi:hypothetical protein
MARDHLGDSHEERIGQRHLRAAEGASFTAAMRRAEDAVCSPGDERCQVFPWGVEEAQRSRSPSGWCLIGWVAADSGRKTWDAWDNLKTGGGRRRKYEDSAT